MVMYKLHEKNAKIRMLFSSLKKTPFHPQWLVFKNEEKGLTEIAQHSQGYVLDLGAGTQKIQHFLSPSCQYISLDYYETATKWYGKTPTVFGDAQVLPFKSKSADTILLLDVLEHLPAPESCLKEIFRVLQPGGKLIIQVPFLYPLHDTPYDFQRWTCFGLQKLAKKHQYQIEVQKSINHPLESAAFLSNLALSKTVLRWIRDKNLLSILIILLPFAIFFNNLLAVLLTYASKDDDFMPTAYRMIWSKKR